ncbi:hypothetical protein PHYBLDRAFT_144775 [Phycomyces blakesleeanus NRRL 1555(-)]|uniref:Uncharacterized protein n=1 Tax=Phycomyces blakesleeanus (strain ATCC 8743b / DSM 1359 / FGSC 10004 / NBRC 33097 / NRRL 1555) TaxID=763407 RepID=A0A162NHK1_PHYB8|nr:hypothetical protein PHYBLDRAFT_144775 [Phycomyces blakesleeanus NRRL 1555(-)]OAD74328.1 hypothetical protein PHYBLDRAFT_144775 [Phycomyces blakesleeanus NRRL 1555(-)]|eukprot:XP_018292368.1 hypothetical protein PHYBLDRAFT_144775 [Phycomyces blakesleeanus NRRL 1555(-)]
MPVDPTHAFIASFAAFFISKYVVNSGGASFRLPLSINSVNSMTGLSDMTQGIQRFVACGNCNKVYKESNVVPECCNFDTKWNSLKDSNGLPFVNHECSIMLTMNIDWFQPFNGVTYSCGAIYLCINNLPRLERYKKENVVLIGLMPGPKEAKSMMPTIQCPSGALVRAALLLVVYDIFAVCKTCGFTSHSSTCACNKCNQQFPCLPDSNAVNYSGFVFSEWVPCTDAELWRMASSDAQRKRLEKENDRFSGLITDAHLAEIQLDADKLVLPEDYTPLGTKIRRGFPFMKADKWKLLFSVHDSDYISYDDILIIWDISKSWCLVYSPVLLRGRLPEAHLGNWTTFVNACQYLSMPSISMAHLDEAHQYLEAFCRECEKLYKALFLLPNMHLHLHLFERCNDILKNYAKNRKDGFEGTYMKKYLEEAYQRDLIRQTLPII